MKPLLIIGVLMLSMGQQLGKTDDDKYQILKEFIMMHNDGSESAILSLIRKRHTSDDLEKLDLKKHISFYNHIIEEFGPLNPGIYQIEEESATKLIVNLIKKGNDLDDKNIDPVDILQVEIDVDGNDPNFLSRGLGLGALACVNEGG